jgi:hypothetical protein
LERYFRRPIGSPYDNLTDAQFYSLFQATKKEQGDQCFQPDHIIRRSKRAVYILRDICLKQRERFCLRFLLDEIPARSWEQLRTVGRRVLSTFADATLENGLIADRNHEAHVAIRSAIAMNRSPSDLRFLFAIGVELGAGFEALFHEFIDRLGDEGYDMAAIRTKIEHILAGFGPRLDRLKENVAAEEGLEYASSNLSDLSDEQSAIANEIIRSLERNSPKLIFVQGSACTGKTHTVRAILSELHRRGIRCLVSATTGIAAVQYQGGQTLHSLFSLGIDEKRSSNFTSNIGQGTARVQFLLSTRLIVIDEVSMPTPSVAWRVSLTLGSITGENHHDWDFGGRQLLFVGDL